MILGRFCDDLCAHPQNGRQRRHRDTANGHPRRGEAGPQQGVSFALVEAKTVVRPPGGEALHPPRPTEAPMRYLGVAALALVLSIPAAARLTRTAPYGFPWLTMWSRGWPPVRAATSVAATLKMAVSGGTATREIGVLARVEAGRSSAVLVHLEQRIGGGGNPRLDGASCL